MRSSLYVLAIVTLLAATDVAASYITMATNFSVTEGADGLTLTVKTENQGDEPAYGVQFEIVVADKQFVSSATTSLGIKQVATAEYSLEGVFGIAGRYPIVIKIYYKDANSYQFSSLSAGFYDYQIPVIPTVSISGQGAKISVDGTGRLVFVVRNNGKTEQLIKLNLFLPNELSVSKEDSELTLGPKQAQTLEYIVENFSALENSTYAVVLMGQYEDEQRHYGITGTTIVEVTGDMKLVGWPIWAWTAAGFLVIAVFILLRSRRKQQS